MNELEFRVDTVKLLNEIVESALRENMGVLKMPINIFIGLLGKVAQRATELDDPKLNILMLNLTLYECDKMEIPNLIKEQEKRIK